MLQWSWGCRYLFKILFSLFSSLRSEIVVSMVVLFSVFEKSPCCFPQWLHQFIFLPTVNQSSLSLHPYQSKLCPIFLMKSHSNRCGLMSHCGFDLPQWNITNISLMISVTGHLCMIPLTIRTFSLRKSLFSFFLFCPFFSQIDFCYWVVWVLTLF